jgi:hypothetical protein
MRKLKGVSVLNAVEALGIAQGTSNEEADLDRILALWGPDPVHPTAAAYWILSEKIAEKTDALLSETQSSPVQEPNTHKRKAGTRDSWVSGSQAFAKRSDRGVTRGGGGGRSHAHVRGATPRPPTRGRFWPRRAVRGRWR